MRGETVLTQFRLCIFSGTGESRWNDSCNRAITIDLCRIAGVMWGDGWSGKKWYVTGSAGFGLNVRMFARRHDLYERPVPHCRYTGHSISDRVRNIDYAEIWHELDLCRKLEF
jgi:hypothetical protein